MSPPEPSRFAQFCEARDVVLRRYLGFLRTARGRQAVRTVYQDLGRIGARPSLGFWEWCIGRERELSTPADDSHLLETLDALHAFAVNHTSATVSTHLDRLRFLLVDKKDPVSANEAFVWSSGILGTDRKFELEDAWRRVLDGVDLSLSRAI
jgi:hypothetical protein